VFALVDEHPAGVIDPDSKPYDSKKEKTGFLACLLFLDLLHCFDSISHKERAPHV